MDSLILPSHISFEEIALKWCDANYNRRSIHYAECQGEIVSRFVEYRYNVCLQAIILDFAAEFQLSDHRLFVQDEKNFTSILDFIKEQSHV